MKTAGRYRVRPFQSPEHPGFMFWGVQKDRGHDAPLRFIHITGNGPAACMDWIKNKLFKVPPPFRDHLIHHAPVARKYGPGYPEH